MRVDLIDLTLCLHVETEKAVLVSDDGVRSTAVWIPKSQCEIEPANAKGFINITLSERLAKEKGLI